MREKLVCYLLGELDADERAQLEARLASEPALRRELDQIRACLGEPEAEADCPEGLASRTADSISRVSHHGPLHDRADAPCRRNKWTLVDVGVAAGVVLAVGMMVLPALPRSRELSRRTLCQDNMRQLGQALVRYSQEHDGYFPYIGPRENAGMFAVRLAESGQLSQQELSRLLLCRAQSLSDGATRVVIRVPKTEELSQARGQALAMLRRWMAGSYAYRLGYVEDGRYYPIRNFSSSRSPILSDAPTRLACGWVSQNHGVDGGQNVLHQDGNVRFQVGYVCPSMDSDLFVNRRGEAAAGRDATDVVLVRSDLTPGVNSSVRPVVPAVLKPSR